MRPREWMLRTMLPLAMAITGVHAAEQAQTKWSLDEFTWVKRVPAEPGAAPNAHPATISPETLEKVLAPVKARDEGKDIPLLGRDDLKELTVALGEALAVARPDEDLILLCTSRHGTGFLMTRSEGVTARLFIRDKALNLIVNDARLEFLTQFASDRQQPTFNYGSRKTASAAILQAPKATRLRADWLTLPLPVEPTPPAVATAPAQSPVPVASPAPMPAATPVAAPKAGEAEYDEAKVKRLRTLQRLRDERLISEAEYREKREAILKSL